MSSPASPRRPSLTSWSGRRVNRREDERRFLEKRKIYFDFVSACGAVAHEEHDGRKLARRNRALDEAPSVTDSKLDEYDNDHETNKPVGLRRTTS